MNAKRQMDDWTEGDHEAESIYEEALDTAKRGQFALESIAAKTVAYFGDLATTLRELTDLTPAEVDVLKRVTRDAPIVTTHTGDVYQSRTLGYRR